MTAPGPPAVGPSRPARPRGGGDPRVRERTSRALVPVLLALLALGVGLRIAAAARPGLWGDELFSLAMATGHSLEHPAGGADPSRGDFVEPAGAAPPEVFRQYTRHDESPAGLGRVARAVLLSDTNPPLYYLLLNPWTRALGTGDFAVRLFSVLWAVLSLPLVWLLGRRLGGERVAWSACVLLSFAPLALYYSYEARMYSLLWFLAAGLAWLSLRLGTDATHSRRHPALWVVVAAAGLLTHYFFGYVWLACMGWLLWRAGAAARRMVLAGAAIVWLLVLPWYVRVPASLARWRVSGGWLDGELTWPRALGRPFALAGELLSGSSYLGGWRHAGIALGAVALLLVIGLLRRRAFRDLFSADLALLWVWLAAACVGPLAFDVLRHTTTSEVPRYALAGLPAAVLLAAVALSRLPDLAHATLLGATLLVWLPGARDAALSRVSRPSQPYMRIAARLDAWHAPGDLVIVSSIPSGVVGLARYLEGDLPMISWVPGLADRDADRDLPRLLAGRRRVALVKVTHRGASAAVEPVLRADTHLVGEERFRRSGAEVLYFGPSGGRDTFAESVE